MPRSSLPTTFMMRGYIIPLDTETEEAMAYPVESKVDVSSTLFMSVQSFTVIPNNDKDALLQKVNQLNQLDDDGFYILRNVGNDTDLILKYVQRFAVAEPTYRDYLLKKAVRAGVMRIYAALRLMNIN